MKTLEKRGTTIPEDSFKKFLEILNTGSISSRQHEIELLANLEYGIELWKHEMDILLYGSISIKTHELEILDTGTISIEKTRNGILVMWDQYLSKKNMKWKFCIEYGIPIERHEMDNLAISIKGPWTFVVYTYFQLKELDHLNLFLFSVNERSGLAYAFSGLISLETEFSINT